MSGEAPPPTESPAFEITHRAADTDGEYVRFEATIHPGLAETDGSADLAHERFLLDNPDEHLHPHQTEVIEVLSGEYAVEQDGAETRRQAGEDVTIPAETPHRHWNPTAEPIRVAHEHRPPRDSAPFGEAMFALAQAGETDEKGMPNLLQFAVLTSAYPGIAYTTDVPIPVQKAMTAVLAPVGRLAGYRADHSR